MRTSSASRCAALAALVALGGAAAADSSFPDAATRGQVDFKDFDPLCVPSDRHVAARVERAYERRALLATRKLHVFPLWKAAFAFRRGGARAERLDVRDGDHALATVSSLDELPDGAPAIGVPTQCARGCCIFDYVEQRRWVGRVCFDDDDRARYVEIYPPYDQLIAVPPSVELDDALVARLTLQPRTDADRALRAELTAHPEDALARLERAAREHPRGRWQRDACLPLSLGEPDDDRSDRIAFCLLYMPDAIPRRDEQRALLRRALAKSLMYEPANEARLALVLADDDATRALYRAGAAFDNTAPTWWGDRPWRETAASMKHVREGTHGGGRGGLVHCEHSCCSYQHYGSLPCMGGAIVTSRVCFDDQLHPTEAWFYQDSEADERCVPDER
jgi:hypothetical protein